MTQDAARAKPNVLRITTTPVLIEIVSEPYVVTTSMGYAPALDVRESQSGKTWLLYASAKSLATELERLRRQHAGTLVGLEIWLSKESDDRMAQYVVEPS